MVPYLLEIECHMRSLHFSLNERDRHRYAAVESNKLGRSGISHISKLPGCDHETIRQGGAELLDVESMGMEHIRRPGGNLYRRKSRVLIPHF